MIRNSVSEIHTAKSHASSCTCTQWSSEHLHYTLRSIECPGRWTWKLLSHLDHSQEHSVKLQKKQSFTETTKFWRACSYTVSVTIFLVLFCSGKGHRWKMTKSRPTSTTSLAKELARAGSKMKVSRCASTSSPTSVAHSSSKSPSASLSKTWRRITNQYFSSSPARTTCLSRGSGWTTQPIRPTLLNRRCS